MLPGRLDVALAAFLVVGDVLLRLLTGAATSRPAMPVTLARKIVSTIGLAEVVPVRRVADGVEPLASGHWPMQAIARADGWVDVPPESEAFRPARRSRCVLSHERCQPHASRNRAARCGARRRAAGTVPRSCVGGRRQSAVRGHLDLSSLPAEAVSLDAALGRVLAHDVSAPIDVPPFDRSTSMASRRAPPIRSARAMRRRAGLRSMPKCWRAAMPRS